MLIESARRAQAAAKEMLALVNEGSASCAEMRDMLAVSKVTVAIMSAAQTAAAANIAGSERHGDGGAEVLSQSAGLSRREAHNQVKTARAIAEMPKLRDAVESGRVSVANATRLAEAVDKTSAGAVDGDGELLAKAESMRPEQFRREARRWVTDRDSDGGEAEHARQRARRSLRVWDGDDGMVHLHGQFDPVTGKRIVNRLRAEARNLYEGDKKNAVGAGPGPADVPPVHGRRPRPPLLEHRHRHGKALRRHLRGRPRRRRQPANSSPNCPTASGCPPQCSNSSPATPSSPASSMTARASPSGAPRAAAPSPRPSGSCSSPDGAAASTAAPTPASARATTSNPPHKADPPKLDNLVPACWTCHHRIHHHGWQIHKQPRRPPHPPPTRPHPPRTRTRP